MKKKIAFILVMVMMANWVVWAEYTYEESSEDDTANALIVVGIVVAVVLLVCGIIALADAEAPDDGIRLASYMDPQSMPETNSSPVLKLLQRIEAGQTKNNDVYVGLRFRF